MLGELPLPQVLSGARTLRAEEVVIAQALKAGAADYFVKPFSPTELTARVGAALRRVARPEPFALGELAIHYEARRVTVAGRPIELTATEYELLRVLSLNAGRVVACDALLRQVWSGRETGDVNLVRNFVKKLRAKLGDDAQSPRPRRDAAVRRPAERQPVAPDGRGRLQGVQGGGQPARTASVPRPSTSPVPCAAGRADRGSSQLRSRPVRAGTGTASSRLATRHRGWGRIMGYTGPP